MNESCANCRFFRAAGPQFGHTHNNGTCRRNPPTTDAVRWPLITGGEWCGEWERRPETEGA